MFITGQAKASPADEYGRKATQKPIQVESDWFLPQKTKMHGPEK